MATALNSDEFLSKPNEFQMRWTEGNLTEYGIVFWGTVH
jgi:hypothetical protein